MYSTVDQQRSCHQRITEDRSTVPLIDNGVATNASLKTALQYFAAPVHGHTSFTEDCTDDG